AVGRARRELGKRRRDVDQPAVERQLLAELAQRVEVMAQRLGALQAQRLLQHGGVDERVAVTVAADPAADAQKRRQPATDGDTLRLELGLEIGIEARQLI